jgi:hypothetical protein
VTIARFFDVKHLPQEPLPEQDAIRLVVIHDEDTPLQRHADDSALFQCNP